MKTVFDPSSRDELISRINLLNENSIAQWGKMNVYQMLKHCTLWDEWVTGSGGKKYKRVFMGRIFGKMALKSVLKDDSPLRKGSPSIQEFIIKQTQGDIAAEKKKWTALVESYAHFSNPGFIHAFFGAMTEEQIGYMVYKHADHHLRQFNC
jgi:hypothetical protein